MSLNIDRVWHRVAGGERAKAPKKHPLIPEGACVRDYKFITYAKVYTLTSQQTLQNNVQDFPAGSIVLGLLLAAAMQAQAATVARGTLDMVRIIVSYPAADGNVVTLNINAAALLGRNGDRQWPEKEIIIPNNGSLTYTLVNLTTSTLDVDVGWNALVLKAAAA